ncbi:hypothetical protein PACTADRAFT_50561 [Pachysolen tannophilus NRRL Y-2460]|uniref:Protoheme IX farnesyltransferase, mitochondrial n=1 Tax=Pachysolen tannophilus NRRL Y-2460 TaxID=669874 RepID=A0A1E4TSI4_PACTA|nr:hypothetical protein PACTADRAFT_50561 [Pachysolen tannophilus NRRL Y-2460]
MNIVRPISSTDSTKFFIKNIIPNGLGILSDTKRFYFSNNGNYGKLMVNNFIRKKNGISINIQFTNNEYLLKFNKLYSTRNSGNQNLISNENSNTLNDNSLLANVAKKTLSCQSESNSINTKINNSHIPFQVKIKESNNFSQKETLKKIITPYIVLTKPKLTILVMLSSICSYALSPYTVGIKELIFLTLGTTLASGSANAINMARESDFDRQMVRTSTRPVVRGIITPTQAYTFAGITGSIGCTMLLYGVNPTVASLGFLNIVLYAWVYTSLKRKSISNTWVGAIVGAIPPLMGWAASSSLNHPGCWCIVALLYAWQFPHFNSLSHNIKDEYKKAGYVMTAFENPRLNARVALRYSLLMFPICFGLSYYNITDPIFCFDSSILTAWMSYWAFIFWRQQERNYDKITNTFIGSKESIKLTNIYAKKLFWASVWYLPGVLVLAMLHKSGQWDRLFSKDKSKEQKNLDNNAQAILA